MATRQDASKVAVKMPDPAKLAEAWTSVLVKGIEAIRLSANGAEAALLEEEEGGEPLADFRP